MDIFNLCKSCIEKCVSCCVDKESELELHVFCDKCPDKGKKELAEDLLKITSFYIVKCSELYDEYCFDSAYFLDKSLAEKYIAIQDQLDDSYTYWISEVHFNDQEININAKVAEYYEYFLYLTESLDYAENFDFTEKVKRIYDGDLVSEVKNDMVYAWSINSLNEAKNLALQLYQEQKKC